MHICRGLPCPNCVANGVLDGPVVASSMRCSSPCVGRPLPSQLPRSVRCQVFTEVEEVIQNVVIVACVVMAVIVAIILFLTALLACTAAAGIVKPVNQLLDVVRGFNRLDFYHQVRSSAYRAGEGTPVLRPSITGVSPMMRPRAHHTVGAS